jgi:sugar-specific transcriptional regulator TrmB
MELLGALTQIGFTEYEAKVYLALLHENPVTGYQISKKAGIPRSMVYEALGRLSRRGAVLETVDGRATLYRPMRPDVLLDRLHQEHQQLMSGLHQGLVDLYNAPVESHVWSITGRRPTITYATQMIREAAEELYLVLSDTDLEDLTDSIIKAGERGVEICALLTGEGELGCGQVAYHPPLESEVQELTHTLLVIADRREALIASSNHETSATITGNRHLIMIARQFVWMELFAQRIYARLGPDLLERLDPEDRKLFDSL